MAAVGAAAEGVAGVPRVAAARPPPPQLLPPVVCVVQRGVCTFRYVSCLYKHPVLYLEERVFYFSSRSALVPNLIFTG